MTTAGMTPGYAALLHGAGIVDLSARGRIRVTGEDRARLLHAMSTNHVQQLQPGAGLYAFFLNAQGRILADAHILCFEDHFLLDVEPASRSVVYEHIDRYIIADDVTIQDITEQTFCLGLEGPGAYGLVEELGLPTPHDASAHATWTELDLAAISWTGGPGLRIYGPAARREELLQKLEGGGALVAADAEADTVRLRNFKPRFGVDFTDATLPQETQQMQALHFQKGCYLGQEIVERIRSRGHVNKQLMGLTALSGSAPASGEMLTHAEKEAGQVTSATLAPDGQVYGIAMARVPHNRAGVEVKWSGGVGELVAPYRPELS